MYAYAYTQEKYNILEIIMIRSMTGFGHGESSSDDKRITIEIKAVNHRYLDLNIKTPRGFDKFEGLIRKYLTSRLDRGKIDVFVNFEENADSQYEILYNRHIARMYYDKIQEMAKDFNLDGSISASSLSRYNEVLELHEVEESTEEIEKLLLKALEISCVANCKSLFRKFNKLDLPAPDCPVRTVILFLNKLVKLDLSSFVTTL